MRSYILVSAFAAGAVAQSTSIDAFPQTSYLQQTNSLGVVTGQPPAATSQPAAASSQPNQPPAASSQPPLVTIPAVGTTGIHTLTLPIPGQNSTTVLTVSAANTTTSIIGALPTGVSVSGAGGTTGGSSPSSGSGSASGTGRPSASGSGAPQGSQSGSAAAPTMKAFAGSLIGAGAFVAAFL